MAAQATLVRGIHLLVALAFSQDLLAMRRYRTFHHTSFDLFLCTPSVLYMSCMCGNAGYLTNMLIVTVLKAHLPSVCMCRLVSLPYTGSTCIRQTLFLHCSFKCVFYL